MGNSRVTTVSVFLNIGCLEGDELSIQILSKKFVDTLQDFFSKDLMKVEDQSSC